MEEKKRKEKKPVAENAEDKPRVKRTAEELAEGHLDKVNHNLAKTMDWYGKLAKTVTSRKHPLTDRQKAYAVATIGTAHQKFLDTVAGTIEAEVVVDIRTAEKE